MADLAHDFCLLLYIFFKIGVFGSVLEGDAFDGIKIFTIHKPVS